MENKILEKAQGFYFLAIGILMYYFLTEIINLGIFVAFRHAFALVLFFSAFLCFLIKPNVARGLTATKSALVYSLPLIVTIAASLFIWFVELVDTEVISRGLSGAFVYTNMISFSLAAAAFLYVFGEKGIWYNLIAILCANLMMIFTIIAQNGIGVYFSEFITLITTFAGVTGDVIVQAEIHELAFCVGAYLIYMALKPRKSIAFYILLALSLFCFLSAFKRIGIIAIAAALFFVFVLKLVAKMNKKTAFALTTILSILLVVILVIYIFLIKIDIFSVLEEMGIETSGRVDIYHAVDKFYEFSPDFLGNGIGFLTYQLSNSDVGVSAVHNDFLQYFIDLGFWGYILWLLSMTVARVIYFGRRGQVDNGIISFVLTVYLVIISSTDNTMNYPLLTTVLAILMIGHGFDDKVRTTEEKMFGYISEPNQKKEGESLL
ncbi:MAG: O-antigen ligase family protein [Clostridia bacterium]|nr:O-antigen ligase family protein [Clostridia bacterium]